MITTPSILILPKRRAGGGKGNYIYNLNDIVKKYGSPTEIVFPFILEERLEDLHDYFRAYMKIKDIGVNFIITIPQSKSEQRIRYASHF